MAGLNSFRGTTTPNQLFIPSDETVRLQFLCEPEDFKYSVEHVSPKNWRNVAQCTFLDGCWACEQQSRKLTQRVRVYIPVLVGAEPYIWAQGIGKGSGINGAIDTLRERGTVLDSVFDVTRSGSGKRTKYTAIPVDNAVAVRYTRPVSLSKVVETLPYEAQENYYKK